MLNNFIRAWTLHHVASPQELRPYLGTTWEGHGHWDALFVFPLWMQRVSWELDDFQRRRREESQETDQEIHWRGWWQTPSWTRPWHRIWSTYQHTRKVEKDGPDQFHEPRSWSEFLFERLLIVSQNVIALQGIAGYGCKLASFVVYFAVSHIITPGFQGPTCMDHITSCMLQGSPVVQRVSILLIESRPVTHLRLVYRCSPAGTICQSASSVAKGTQLPSNYHRCPLPTYPETVFGPGVMSRKCNTNTHTHTPTPTPTRTRTHTI